MYDAALDIGALHGIICADVLLSFSSESARLTASTPDGFHLTHEREA